MASFEEVSPTLRFVLTGSAWHNGRHRAALTPAPVLCRNDVLLQFSLLSHCLNSAKLAPCHPDMLAAAGSPRFLVPPPPPPQQPQGMVGVFECDEQPVSRTYQYRKVMKPMLERKRRARINRCLDELKELMVSALAAEGENVAKLEKADILELTVRHLHRLRRRRRLAATPEASYADRFRAGFTHCANEVSRFLAGNDPAAAARLLPHLGACLHACQAADSPAHSPSSSPAPAPAPEDAPAPPSPSESSDSNCEHQRSADSPPLSPVWRPW